MKTSKSDISKLFRLLSVLISLTMICLLRFSFDLSLLRLLRVFFCFLIILYLMVTLLWSMEMLFVLIVLIYLLSYWIVLILLLYVLLILKPIFVSLFLLFSQRILLNLHAVFYSFKYLIQIQIEV